MKNEFLFRMCALHACCMFMDVRSILFWFAYICVFVWLQVQGPLRKCPRARYFWATHYCSPLVCIPAVLGGLAVWKKSQPSVRAQRSVVQPIRPPVTFPMLEAKLEAEARRSPLPRFSGKVVRAMYTVMVIQYHCDKTFSNHLGKGEGRSPVKIFLMTFFVNFGDKFLVFKNEIWVMMKWLKKTQRKKEKVKVRDLYQLKIKIDVWKYIRTIIIGLYAVCRHLLDNHNRAHSLRALTSSFASGFGKCHCSWSGCT